MVHRALPAALLLALPLLPARAGGPAPEAPGGTILVRRWLALDPVDLRGRVPFNANAPFARHLLDRGAPPPVAGGKVKGDRAEAAWREVAAAEDGTVDGGEAAWFHGVAERPADAPEAVFLARLEGASALFVDGAGFAGDVYRGGLGPFPVALRGGRNLLYVAGPRGPWRLALEPWTGGEAPALLPEDATLPDEVGGESDGILQPPDSRCGAVRLLHPSLRWLPAPVVPRLLVEGKGIHGHGLLEGSDLPPLWTTKLPFTIERPGRAPAGADPEEVLLRLVTRDLPPRPVGPPLPLRIERRAPGEARRESYLSRVDGSAQVYAVLPPLPSKAPPEGLVTVLSLHGAGVDCLGQARSYSPREGVRVVAPTNRRPFGFDWEDWGRRDAMDVLGQALGKWWADPDRVCLTGHSMGGHGAWHLAANDPDRWAAVAPSAGWCSFDTYGGGPRPETPLAPLWRGAGAGSRTEDLIANLVPIPTFVLHGTKDDNVPPSEAEGMLGRIEKAGGKPLRRFQEGAGHWWDGEAAPGVDCVDWPGIFELFLRSHRPAAPEEFDFTSVDPSVDAEHHGVRVVQPLEYGKPSRVKGSREGGKVRIATENVRRFDLLPVPDGTVAAVAVDGQEVRLPGEEGREIHLARNGDRWVATLEGAGAGKTPDRSGPFKRLFDNHFVLVVGTGGTEEENREMLDLARYHAGQWWVRANGTVRILRDSEVSGKVSEPEWRDFVLYGNADVNRAWGRLVPADCPIRVRQGSIGVGDREWKGEGLGAAFVFRSGHTAGLVGAFASTGARGTRLGYGLLPFVSGVGYPDYSVFGEEFLRSGDGGVLAAGWFDHRWALQPGGFVREERR